MGTNKKRGISLIVLVITIIVMIILATAIILSLSNSGIISKANKAKFQSDIKSMQEELELKVQDDYAENNGQSTDTIVFEDLSGASKYEGEFTVIDGTLRYVQSKLTEEEQEWAKEVGIKAAPYVLINGVDGVTIDANKMLTTNWYNENTYTAIIPENIGNDITIPNSVITIGSNAFRGCTSLTSVTIPNSVTSIGLCAFSITGLTSVTIPNSVTSIGSGAFSSSKLTSVIIPNSVTSIESATFQFCSSLASVTIPNSVTTIGSYAFGNCSALIDITIPNSVTSIGSGAFMGCTSLTSITIPNSVTSIEKNPVGGSYNTFDHCTNLTVTISEATAKRIFGDSTTEASLKETLGVKSVAFN